MTVMSIPACSSRMAAVCRRVCGVTCFPRSDGQAAQAVAVYLARRCSTASRLSRAPVRVGNSGSSGTPGCSVSQPRNTRTVSVVSGVARSLRPCRARAARATTGCESEERVRPRQRARRPLALVTDTSGSGLRMACAAHRCGGSVTRQAARAGQMDNSDGSSSRPTRTQERRDERGSHPPLRLLWCYAPVTAYTSVELFFVGVRLVGLRTDWMARQDGCVVALPSEQLV